jgi:hypothetical protein
MKIVNSISALALLFASVVSANAQQGGRRALVVTASNAASNQLLVYDTSGKLVQTVATGGQGGASGNSGGIATWRGRRVAAVNFGSQTVAILDKNDDGFQLKQVVSAASSPLSVAFGHGHLYILGATTIESHQVFDWGVSPGPDGMASLVKADGSAAQVGVLGNELIISEKSNVIETVNLKGDGAIVGAPSTVANIPANVDAPFGLVTRGNDAWVTIAHADEISLVRKDAVVTVTGSGTQHAPCWLALDGPYLFSSNSPSKSISRYLVFGKKIIQQVAVAATLNGSPTDIAHLGGFVAVIDGAGAISHLSVFKVDGDGDLSLRAAATINSAANGVAIVGDDD